MVSSAYELGISDEHEGIILLEDDAPVGMPLADTWATLSWKSTSCRTCPLLSMIGIAREGRALTGQA